MTETRNMNTTSTSACSGRDRHHAESSRGVRRGRLAPREVRVLAAPWGVPLLLACFVGVTGPACRPAGQRCQRRAGGYMGNSVRPGMRASELRTLRERSEPELLTERGSPEGDDPLARVWAGVRPRKNGGGCRAASPAGSRAEPGRRRPRGQPPAGKVECRTADGVRVAAPWLKCHGLRPAQTWGLALGSVV